LLALPETKAYETLRVVNTQLPPGIPVLVVTSIHPSLNIINEMLHMQILGVIKLPLNSPKSQAIFLDALERAPNIARRRRLERDLTHVNDRLNRRLQEINTIYSVGKYVASTLNLERVLERVVEASINLTQADEGFILLKEGDKLFLRASKNMREDIAQRLHVEATDSVAWQVIKSGRPTMLHRETKITTGYLVRALLYVPLQTPGQGTIGVLGVVNLQRERPFTEHQLFTLSSLADFAAIALENARLFSVMEAEQLRLRSILEHASEAILMTDINNHLLLWSQTAAGAFEIPASAQGCPIGEVVRHSAIQELFEQATDTIKNTELKEPVLHTEVALSRERVFNAQLTTIPHIGRVMIMQNITHLKELDRLKSEFVSTVSHDLRTPLTTIQGYIELLDRVGPLNEMQNSFIEKALRSLTHITELIGDLLDIGRIEAGYDLEMEPCRIDKIVAEVGEANLQIAAQQDVKLRWELGNDPLWVQGSSRRLRQVMENLVSNALKYNRPGGLVEMKARRDNDHIIVHVRDTGIGIPLEEQPRVFERFYRVRSNETEDIRGTGLGLAIVKSVVEKHKGRIWVESVVGHGSEFSFVIPALSKVT
jgi:two-component system NtrC family sensor kinase